MGVLHFAAYIAVGESVENPGKYYHNNVCNTLNLLDEMLAANIQNFIFSSSAAIYGNDPNLPKKEDMIRIPISPYGVSKLAGEAYMQSYHPSEYHLKHIPDDANHHQLNQ